MLFLFTLFICTAAGMGTMLPAQIASAPVISSPDDDEFITKAYHQRV